MSFPLIIFLVIFQLLFFAGIAILFRKVMTKDVQSATKHLDQMGEEYNEKERHLNKQIEEVKLQSEELIRQAQAEADKLKADMLKQAEAEKENILNQARSRGEEMIQQADKSRTLLITEMEQRIAKEATKRACELIQGALPEEFKRTVHSHWIEDLIKNGLAQAERLHIPQDVTEAHIATPFSLSHEQKESLSRKMKEALGRELSLKEEINPALIAGISISLGSIVLDGSLKNKILEEAVKQK